MSLKNPRLDLWDLNRKERINRFRGHIQEMHIIKCSFGGANESLVVCGSENGSIFIWNKDKGDLLVKLEAHSQIVNAVHWNPTEPFVFASCSDDQTIKIWGLEEMEIAE